MNRRTFLATAGVAFVGTYHTNIMISEKAEGTRFALIREDTPVPKDHPEARQAK